MIKQQIKHFRALNKWFKTPLGRMVTQEFCQELLPLNEFMIGDTVLQLGNCGNNFWLDQLRYTHKWVASPFSVDANNQMECSLNQLPLARSSVDCVIVPLSLEPFGNNLSLMDEIDRILKPMGFVVFLSINPWSSWGGAMKLGLLGCFANNRVKMRSPYNLNRTFLQRGYRQCSLINFCYFPPINNQAIIQKLFFLEEVGKMVWPVPSGLYCYVAQKYEYISPSLIVQPSIRDITKEYIPLQPVIN